MNYSFAERERHRTLETGDAIHKIIEYLLQIRNAIIYQI